MKDLLSNNLLTDYKNCLQKASDVQNYNSKETTSVNVYFNFLGIMKWMLQNFKEIKQKYLLGRFQNKRQHFHTLKS